MFPNQSTCITSRETSEDELLARDTTDNILEERSPPKTIFSREDSAGLQAREPFAFLAPYVFLFVASEWL